MTKFTWADLITHDDPNDGVKDCGCTSYVSHDGSHDVPVCHCGEIYCREHHKAETVAEIAAKKAVKKAAKKPVKRPRLATGEVAPRCYKSETTASNAMRVAYKTDPHVYVYSCFTCEKWHIGIDTGAPWHRNRTRCDVNPDEYRYHG